MHGLGGDEERMIYSLLKYAVLATAKAIFRISINGCENVPRSGGAVLAANHVSYLDPPLIGCAVRRRVNFMAKEELFRNRFMSSVLYRAGAFPVRRSQMDRGALQEAFERVGRGELLLIFPEGTISQTGDFLPPKDGVGMIVAQTGAVVVPVFISGSEKALPLGGRFRPAKVCVYFGKPMDFSVILSQDQGRDLYARISSAIMEEIKQLKLSAMNA